MTAAGTDTGTRRYPQLAHCGAYTAVGEHGRLVRCEPFAHDSNPSPMLERIMPMVCSAQRISRPAVRRGGLETGNAQGGGVDQVGNYSWGTAQFLLPYVIAGGATDHTQEDWLRQLAAGRALLRKVCRTRGLHEEFCQRGHVTLPPPAGDFVLFEDFRRDPQRHALRTPSGRIELYSKTLAGFGLDDCSPHPRRAPAKWLGAKRCACISMTRNGEACKRAIPREPQGARRLPGGRSAGRRPVARHGGHGHRRVVRPAGRTSRNRPARLTC